MNKNIISFSILLIVIFFISACGPSVEQAVTMTAAVWTATSTITQTFTPTPTATKVPTATSTPKPTLTPIPTAVVIGDYLNFREGPGSEYLKVGSLTKNEEIEVLGQFNDCDWLKISSRSQSLSGWISGDKRYIKLFTACENIPLGIFRSFTGLINSDQLHDGSGKISIENGSPKDSTVVLAQKDRPYIAAYIRSGESYTINGIRDDIYHLYFSTGDKWNGKIFTASSNHYKFEDVFEFTTTNNNQWPFSRTIYTVWSVTLQSVAGGNTSVKEIGESEFPETTGELSSISEENDNSTLTPTTDLLCRDTSNMVGSTVNCKIPIAYCSYQPATSGSPTFCNDAKYPNHNFIMVVWGSDWSNLDGRCINIFGDITIFNGKPQIVVTNESQVTDCN